MESIKKLGVLATSTREIINCLRKIDINFIDKGGDFIAKKFEFSYL